MKKAIHLSAVLAALLFGLLAVVAAPASAQSDIDDYSGPPSITVDKPEVECGDNVVVTGTGFPPNSKVDVTLPPGSGPTSVVGAIDGGGRARQVTTPPTIYSLADGSYIVTVDTDATGTFSFTYTTTCSQIGTITFSAPPVSVSVEVISGRNAGGGGGGGGTTGGGSGSTTIPPTGSNSTKTLLRGGLILLGAGGMLVLATNKRRRNAPAI